MFLASHVACDETTLSSHISSFVMYREKLTKKKKRIEKTTMKLDHDPSWTAPCVYFLLDCKRQIFDCCEFINGSPPHLHTLIGEEKKNQSARQISISFQVSIDF